MGRGTGNIIYQSLFGTVEDIRLWQPEFGPEENHFVSGNFAGFSLYISSEGSAKLRWEGRGTLYFLPSYSLYYFYWKALHAGVPFSNPGHKIVIIDFLVMNKKKRSCDRRGRGARSVQFGMLKSPERRVRAAHGRAREAKTN